MNHCYEWNIEKCHEYTNIEKLRRIQTIMAAARYVTSGAGISEISARLVFVGHNVLPTCLAFHKAEVFIDERSFIQLVMARRITDANAESTCSSNASYTILCAALTTAFIYCWYNPIFPLRRNWIRQWTVLHVRQIYCSNKRSVDIGLIIKFVLCITNNS